MIDLSLESQEANRLELKGFEARNLRTLQRLGWRMFSDNIQLQYHMIVCHLEWELRSHIFQASTERCSLDTIAPKHQIPWMDLSLLETQEANRSKMTPPGEESHQRTHPAPS